MGDRDLDYPTVKGILGQGGYLSQFVNFKKCPHHNPRNDKDKKQSHTIICRVGAQIINKCGILSWFVQIPPTIPLPAMFVGIDVFHAPRTYNPATKTKSAKESVAAIVALIVDSRQGTTFEVKCYQQTFKQKKIGQEYHLGEALQTTGTLAIKNIGIKPKSCFIFRDGVGDTAVSDTIKQELPFIRKAVSPSGDVPLAYMVCQKRIATKFVRKSLNEGMPAGKSWCVVSVSLCSVIGTNELFRKVHWCRTLIRLLGTVPSI
mmetsp:Transcript_31901/g.45362  ORF Transcript_31901/g.45362 Transcript_31901/m.45362 type:complete len:261 (+) Transcript_31901:1655-2437(+)